MRKGTIDDAILGVVPGEVHQPATRDEAKDLLGRLCSQKKRVVFVGGATALGLGGSPLQLDAVIRTGGLAQVLEYAPSDQVVIVEAGLTLEALQRELSGSGQRLALDPPMPERATIGGIVAASSFGPRRARFGAPRDLIIGVGLVRADGARARGGGKVVKNVAGFDLPKLMCGSLGTLGLIETVTLRVHPLPEKEATALIPARSAASIHDAVLKMRRAQLEPSSVVAMRVGPAAYEMLVRFEGFEAGVLEQSSRLRALLSLESLSAEEAAGRWRTHDAVRGAGDGGGLGLKLAALPSAFGAIEEATRPLFEALPDAGFAWYATLGLGFFSAPLLDGAALGVRSAIESARLALVALGGSLVIERAPLGVRASIDAWGPAPAAIRLHRAVKDRFDPEALLAPGRFLGGI